jgi:hypothetical protein
MPLPSLNSKVAVVVLEIARHKQNKTQRNKYEHRIMYVLWQYLHKMAETG